MRAQGRARPPYDSGSNDSLILSGDWYRPTSFAAFAARLPADGHDDFIGVPAGPRLTEDGSPHPCDNRTSDYFAAGAGAVSNWAFKASNLSRVALSAAPRRPRLMSAPASVVRPAFTLSAAF